MFSTNKVYFLLIIDRTESEMYKHVQLHRKITYFSFRKTLSDE